jgi:hypothetical protein
MQKKQINCYLKIIAYLILGACFIFTVYYLLTPKPTIDPKLKTTIDSLVAVNTGLVKKQVELSNKIELYKETVANLDTQIVKLRKRKLVIRRYYRRRIVIVNNYTPTQIDSFYKKRYNY